MIDFFFFFSMALGLSLCPAEKADAQQAKAKVLIRKADRLSGPISFFSFTDLKTMVTE